MNKNPLEDLANRIGMYAYLAAVGGLRYWPAVREATIEEQIAPVPRARALDETVPYEYRREDDRIPA
jgi:hypothetical protein